MLYSGFWDVVVSRFRHRLRTSTSETAEFSKCSEAMTSCKARSSWEVGVSCQAGGSFRFRI